MISDIIAVLTVAACVVQLFYLYFFFYRANSKKDKIKGAIISPGGMPPYALRNVSVIICAKNEAANLSKHLPFILNQDYKNEHGNICYEVIVVNDQSDDDTEVVLNALEMQHTHLRCVHIHKTAVKTLPGKKFALSQAVKHAKYDTLLMTDADCQPASPLWIKWMAYPFSEKKEIVAGYGAITPTSGLLNKFVRMETIQTFLQFFTYNTAGIPYMAVGRNLACLKKLLLLAQSEPVWAETPSGDDDLLINICATKDNMSVNYSEQSFTWSESKKTWRAWWKQKQRHMSTGKYYNQKAQTVAALYALSQALVWVGTIFCFIFLPSDWQLMAFVLGGFTVRYMLFWHFYNSILHRFGEYELRFFWFAFDIGWTIYNFVLSPYIFWKNKQQWK